MDSLAAARGRFATTQWSVVVAAGDRGSDDAAAALARLCSLYWYPVFAFVRRRGYSAEDAQELTQGFFTRLIDKNEVGRADRARGRFRTFLLTACSHFLANERDHARRLKRGGDRVRLSIDTAVAEARYQRALSHGATPEREYDRQWCLTLLDAVLERLRRDYAAAGKEPLFERLRGVLAFDDAVGSYADAAADLGMTPAAVKVAAYRLRRRYREALRATVADTVAPSVAASVAGAGAQGVDVERAVEDAVQDEIRHLLRTLSTAT